MSSIMDKLRFAIEYNKGCAEMEKMAGNVVKEASFNGIVSGYSASLAMFQDFFIGEVSQVVRKLDKQIRQFDKCNISKDDLVDSVNKIVEELRSYYEK